MADRTDHHKAMRRLEEDARERMQPGPKGGGTQHQATTDRKLHTIPTHSPAPTKSVNPKE